MQRDGPGRDGTARNIFDLVDQTAQVRKNICCFEHALATIAYGGQVQLPAILSQLIFNGRPCSIIVWLQAQ